jgi:outer membrane protein OmpA-like peptidoglycan-associated protein
MKGISNYYVASDLFFDIDKTKDIEIKSDAEGYFFFFKSFKVMDDIDNEIVVLMERLKEGKKLGLPEIQFEMGTSNPTGNAIQLMNRLAEFLLSNPEVRIEIGGHVNEVGDNSNAAKKISEARAKRVYSYLIEKGVDKHRLEYKGFGNTEMIYPIPKNHFEEQANRRVEIRIL